jgi:hypothetical protein
MCISEDTVVVPTPPASDSALAKSRRFASISIGRSFGWRSLESRDKGMPYEMVRRVPHWPGERFTVAIVGVGGAAV